MELFDELVDSAKAAASGAISDINWNPSYSPLFQQYTTPSTKAAITPAVPVTSTAAAEQGINYTGFVVLAACVYLVVKFVR